LDKGEDVTAGWEIDRMSSFILIQGYSKNKYTLSKIYFTSTVEHIATCYI
jgi:hypothetical protein